MRTISSVVEQIINASPYLNEVMSDGIVNNAELARRIRPEVEARLMEEVTIASISMAIHRMSKNLERANYGTDFIKNIHDITVRSNLVEYVFDNSVDLSKLETALIRVVKGNRNSYFNYSRGLSETLIIIDIETEKKVSDMLNKISVIKKPSDLSAITLRLPEASLDVPGVYYLILRSLALKGINFVEVSSVTTEFSIIFRNEDIDKAFSTLKQLTIQN